VIVEHRRWIEPGAFNRMFAACNLIPGPSSTELAMFLGFRLAGWPGLAVAAVSFITPAMLIMLGLAVLYDRYAGSRLAHLLLYGIRPVVVAIIAWATLDLALKVLERRWMLALIPVAFLMYEVGVNPVFVLALCGLAGAAASLRRSRGLTSLVAAPWLGPHPERMLLIFLTFLKIGAVSFGSGYVLFAFLDSDFVQGLRWLRPTQLVDAVALGQVTPGPVFTTATFLGYLFAGIPGALLATLAIFLPGLALVPLLDRVVKIVESRPVLRTFLDCVNAAVIGLIIAVGVSLARASVIDLLTVLLAIAAFAIILWRPLAAPIVVAGGAIAGVASGLLT
jgi:chromate transporter